MRRAAALLLLLACAACATSPSPSGRVGVGSSSSPATPQPAPSSSVVPGTGPTARPQPHVFVVVMENKSYAEAMAEPFTARLAADNALATNYRAVSHPSLPNYLALTSGSTHGITDDAYHVLPDAGIGRQLSDAGVSWRAYMESMGGSCLSGNNVYAIKHDPFAYYGGACPTSVVSMDQLGADLASPAQAPRFSWISPNLCHDGHDCSAQVADAFLSDLVGRITTSSAFSDNGVLFITWDEDDGSGSNRVPLIAVGAAVHAGSSDRQYDHYSLLATVEDLLGVSRLGAAASAAPLSDLVTLPPVP